MQCGASPKRKNKIPESANDSNLDAVARVSFDDAQYEVKCPTCGGNIIVRGISLSTRTSIKCPYSHGVGQTQKISVGDIDHQRLIEGQVIYRRWTDFFSYSGRLSVSDYWLSLLFVLPFLVIIKLYLGPIYPLIFFALVHPLWVKRYHDHGMSTDWIAIQVVAATTSCISLYMIPKGFASLSTTDGSMYPVFFDVIQVGAALAAVVTGIIISSIPGQSKTNRYGPPKSEVKRVWW
jgi:uncharacterized membrane protein YhaH (DUF805 family)